MKAGPRKTGAGPRKAARRRGAAEGEAPVVLVVDDFEDNRALYVRFLGFSGFQVAEAADGHEALVKARELQPELIVMDLSLPGLDGWEATRRLKADPRTRDTIVIALTGHALTGHEEGARAAGCDAFLTKPCLPETLVDEVRRLLGTPSQGKSGR